MIRKPKISVIIPVYNGEKTLKQCLKSVLNQTYKNYEVIVIDNNSTDKTKEIIKEFRKKDKKLRYLFEVKRSRGAARYRGEINAKGEIVLMTDSDCIVPKNWVQEIIKPITDDKQIAVQGCKKPIVSNYWTKHIQKTEEYLIKIRIKDNKVGLLDTANFAIKKSILQDVGYTNPKIKSGHDSELMVRLKIHRHKIFFKNITVLHYHPDTGLKVFCKIFRRAEWQAKIRIMYNNQRVSFGVDTLMDHLHYTINILLELLTLHKNFKYDLVSGLAWRLGLAYGWLKK